MKKIKHAAFFISILYLTIYLPIFWTTYFPAWYELNCKWNSRCGLSGPDNRRTHIRELVGFLRHAEKLEHIDWSAKEKRHLYEVRIMLDMLLAGAAAAISTFFLTFDRKRLRRFTLINSAVILCSGLILPFFKQFWRHGFHEIIFNNTDWINYPTDVTYYITPRVFFLNTFIVIIAISLIINFCGFLILRNQSQQRQELF